MIDIHNHVLFDIDDGSPDVDISMEMCIDAYKNGYKTIVVTPHFIDYEKIEEFVEERNYKASKLQKYLRDENIPLQIKCGAELFLHNDVLRAENLDDLTINNSRYMLCELPLGPFKVGHTLVWIDELIERGYVPILAHPERYFEFHRNFQIIDELLERNVIFQVNLDSLIGKNGLNAQRMSVDMVCRGIAKLIGTDAHDTKHRHIRTRERIKDLPYDISEEMFLDCIKINPQKILNNEEI